MILDDGGDATHVMVVLHNNSQPIKRLYGIFSGEEVPRHFQVDEGHRRGVSHGSSQVIFASLKR